MRVGHPKPLLSIIIPTFNEQHNIGWCLEALSRVNLADRIEVIILDNGSTDNTRDVARTYASTLDLRVATYPHVTIGALRNRGGGMARGDLFGFLDADCEVAKDWVEQAIQLNHEFGGILGSMYNAPGNASWVATVWTRHEKRPRSVDAAFVPGGNMVVSRSDFEKAGCFDEKLRSNEDFEFCRRAASNGIGVRDSKKLVVWHFGAPQTITSLWRQQQWHGADVFKVFFGHMLQGWNLRPVLYTVYIVLAITAVVISTLIAAIWGDHTGIWLSVGALLVAPVALSVMSVYPNRRWPDLVPLAVLFFVYGISRAFGLFNFRESRDKLHHRQV
jgi:glycosyltransferase involved in cell wall biosynthesis